MANAGLTSIDNSAQRNQNLRQDQQNEPASDYIASHDRYSVSQATCAPLFPFSLADLSFRGERFRTLPFLLDPRPTTPLQLAFMLSPALAVPVVPL